jgi:KaiC/GvpD/RAD55 family RecA-like ATPase
MNEALQYARMGWRVFPCIPGQKEPLGLLVPNGCKDATTNEVKIREWWTHQPDANIGIATGRESNLTVLDMDGEIGKTTGASYISPTKMQTGNGEMLFFAYEPRLKNSVKKLGPGLDIRTEGGYVCAPPSLHPNGKRYTWLLGPFADVLPKFPNELLTQATIVKDLETKRPAGWEADILEGLKEGNRDDSFARLVGKFHHIGLDRSTIWALLLPHARRVNFAESQLNKVIQSICNYERNTADASIASASVDQFLSDSTPTDWLCTPIISKGSIGFIAGLPETYKTWATIDLAVEVARGGGLWLGLYLVVGGRVLFVDQERAKGETQRRFRGVLNAKGLDPKSLKDSLFIRSGTTTRLDVDESYSAFRRQVAEIRPSLIVVDSFATFHISSENSRVDIQKMLERVKEIRTEFGCVFLFIDHENKLAFSDGSNGVNPTAFRLVGSVGKIAAAEFVLTVRRIDPQTCAVYHTKATVGPRVPGFAVHVVDTDNGGIRIYGETGAK